MDLLLGIDIGTSSTKAVLIDPAGRVVGMESAAHPISQPRPGWSEQAPEDWWGSTVAAVRGALAKGRARGEGVRGIGLSGQMHGSVLLGKESLEGDGRTARALRPAILWNDQRTGAECREIEAAVGGRPALVGLVGNAALTGFTLPKVLWVREHEPEVFGRVAKFLLPKDYIRLRMTGRAATDVGDAAGTLLLDVDRRVWSERMIRQFRLEAGMLPAIFESAEVTGELTAWAAAELGLRAGTPVVGGSGDNQSGAVGAGVVSAGLVLCALGTSGVMFAHSDAPRKDGPGRLHTMPAATGDARSRTGWCNTGVMLSAAGSLHWCRETLFPTESYERLLAEAAGTRPGCEGLSFMPYLTGERCPYADPLARGGWVGLTSRHRRGHLVRAVLEGVTFAMAQILDLVRGIGVPVETVRLGGGGAKSELWRQMIADVCGSGVELPNTEEGPAFGAGLMAGVGVGVWPSVASACGATIAVAERREPGPAAAEYRAARGAYDGLYPALRGWFGSDRES
ncbi:MAG: xylulokinase [Phycisphaerales bacterium]|nr:xylulokinase [Phycisphaerales bacterium]